MLEKVNGCEGSTTGADGSDCSTWFLASIDQRVFCLFSIVLVNGQKMFKFSNCQKFENFKK